MENSGDAIVWYVEPKTFLLRCTTIGAHELKSGSTYEWEAMWKMPDDVEHYEVILMNQAGNPAERERIERLKRLAEELRRAAAGDDTPL